MADNRWPRHCRDCQYRHKGSAGRGGLTYCYYAGLTGKSLIAEYGHQKEPGELQRICKHWKDGKKAVRR